MAKSYKHLFVKYKVLKVVKIHLNEISVFDHKYGKSRHCLRPHLGNYW